MRILLVDDDPSFRQVVKQRLDNRGYAVTIAGNGQEALDVLRNASFDVVLSDWDMPTLNGPDLCRAIRSADPSGNLYLIMVTGRSLPQDEVEGFAAGADAYLTKPFNTEDLLSHLDVARKLATVTNVTPHDVD